MRGAASNACPFRDQRMLANPNICTCNLNMALIEIMQGTGKVPYRRDKASVQENGNSGEDQMGRRIKWDGGKFAIFIFFSAILPPSHFLPAVPFSSRIFFPRPIFFPQCNRWGWPSPEEKRFTNSLDQSESQAVQPTTLVTPWAADSWRRFWTARSGFLINPRPIDANVANVSTVKIGSSCAQVGMGQPVGRRKRKMPDRIMDTSFRFGFRSAKRVARRRFTLTTSGGWADGRLLLAAGGFF